MLTSRNAVQRQQHRIREILSRNADLPSLSTGGLVAITESLVDGWERRFAAGTVLGRRGDPRVGVGRPELVALPGGRVTMGLPSEEVDAVFAAWRVVGVRRLWIEKECPAHELVLPPFALARFPVTNIEYRDFLADASPPCLPSSWPNGCYPEERANHPVWALPPEACEAYAAWLAHRSGRPFRLPTEAEWEYAAAGSQRREFPWGAAFDPARANTAESWHDGAGGTTPVGMYPLGRTATGLDDMAGNVEECTADNYRPYPGGQIADDGQHRASPAYRVARGGSFMGHGDLARCRRRHSAQAAQSGAVGFRIAQTL